MRTILLLLLLAPVMVGLILFGLSNRDIVTLRLWPFDLAVPAELSVAVLGFSAVAFLAGALLTWFGTLRYRYRARKMQDAARVLEAEVAELRGRLAREVGPVPPAKPAAGQFLALPRAAA